MKKRQKNVIGKVMLQEQFESALSIPELWTNSVDWFKFCNIRQSTFTDILGNMMKVCSELFFIIHAFTLLEQIRLDLIISFGVVYHTGKGGFCNYRAV